MHVYYFSCVQQSLSHYQLFPILFIVFNDGFIIEIMIVLYCVYIKQHLQYKNTVIFFHFIFLRGPL